ncbi:hypothetical protein GCM10011506_09840 [Marivirga lumbricoides]|uniref:UPF0323 domain-containing protein n=1 Tax=Marivirga lumbricoides TaxID=1046115 RepID=A0A2T4DR16_9BACT|nr:hypothetical protein C9994_08130 [Marivirga lumbricoides]GGC26459.1 hypothetical protein GCM10011506_09840 [Marivirga lumbricoides]
MKKNTINISTWLKKIGVISFSGVFLAVQSCGGNGSPRLKEGGETKTVLEATKGTATELEEIEPGDDYKIIDERLIDERENSIAIVHNLDGTTDTLSLMKIKAENTSGTGSPRYRGLSSILMFGLASSFFRGNLSQTTPNPGAYKNQNAYNKSVALNNDLKNSATSRRVTSPGKASRGYGAGKSFRSHGG